jgi:hypothetical protein
MDHGNLTPTTEQDHLEVHEDTLPTFIYTYKGNSNQLYSTNLVTGEQSSHQLPSYLFKRGCCWSEVPGGRDSYIRGGSED